MTARRGRPPSVGRPVVVTVNFPEAVGIQLKAFAAAHDRFVASVVRAAVVQYLASHPNTGGHP